MSLIEDVDVVFYGICNMNRSVAFYEGVLGLELSRREGNDWAQFTVGSTEIGLYGELATPPHQGGATVSFRVSDIKVFDQVLVDAAVQKDVVEDMGGALSLEFYDPDGNKLVAMQVLEG